jgi:hypothetical protein
MSLVFFLSVRVRGHRYYENPMGLWGKGSGMICKDAKKRPCCQKLGVCREDFELAQGNLYDKVFLAHKRFQTILCTEVYLKLDPIILKTGSVLLAFHGFRSAREGAEVVTGKVQVKRCFFLLSWQSLNPRVSRCLVIVYLFVRLSVCLSSVRSIVAVLSSIHCKQPG